jgi:hypothetical protein
MTRSVSLPQVVEPVRLAVELVEAQVPKLAAPGEETWLREAVLRYGRDIAFAAAEVYASDAEERGAWDARLEALVVDALLRSGLDLLAGIHGDQLIAVVGGRHDPLASGRLLLALFGPGPVMLGPAVPDLAAAGRHRGLRLSRARRSRSWERPRRWRSCTASGWPPYRPDTARR